MTQFDEIWRRTRHGAWAGRGFRYQDAVAAHFMVMVWAGRLPLVSITPEGFDDLELSNGEQKILIQIKSKGPTAPPFTEQDLSTFEAVQSERKQILGGDSLHSFLVLERATPNLDVEIWPDQIGNLEEFGSRYQLEQIDLRATSLITEHTSCTPAVAQIIFHGLVRLAGELSNANASANRASRSSASPSDIERHFEQALRTIDPAALNEALNQRLCVPIDLASAVDQPNFYSGVDVVPGHIAAGLLFDRPDDVQRVCTSLKSKRATLITGPSGAGKSAVQWLAVQELRHGVRWFQISRSAALTDVNRFLDFISGLQPSAIAPVGLVIDDVGQSQSQLWYVLERALLTLPGLLLLGSIREEDTALVAEATGHDKIPIGLSEDLAEAIWLALRERAQSDQIHWRESFEQSEGLLLEYVHLLTKGERLDTLIGGQIARREREKRFDELAILRVVSCAAVTRSPVEPKLLANLLDISPDAFRLAARRLEDEHLIRQKDDGSIDGLHELRSRTLLELTHRNSLETTADSAEIALSAVKTSGLPSCLVTAISELRLREQRAIEAIAGRFEKDHDPNVIAAAFRGFGLLTLREAASAWAAILQEVNLEPAHWWMATLLANARRNIPGDNDDIPGFNKINRAVVRLNEIQVSDRRVTLAKELDKSEVVACPETPADAVELLSAMAPMSFFPAVPTELIPLRIEMDAGLDELQSLLSTAYVVDPELAEKMIEKIGGQQYALDCAYAATPWISKPVLEKSGKFTLAICADYYCVNEDPNTSLNDRVTAICEMLLAFAPTADGVVVRALDASGEEVTVPGFGPIASKAIPRENLPAAAVTNWNRALSELVLALAGIPSETEFAHHSAAQIQGTAKILEQAERAFCRDKVKLLKDSFFDQLSELSSAANAYAPPAVRKLPVVGASKVEHSTEAHHPVPSMVAAVTGNLLPRMFRYDPKKPDRGLPSFIGDQISRLDEVESSPLWRLVDEPPTDAIQSIRASLERLHAVLSELVHAPVSYGHILIECRKRLPKDAPRRAQTACLRAANARMERQTLALQSRLKASGLQAQTFATVEPISDSPYWPPGDLIAIIEADTLLSYLEKLDQLNLAGVSDQEHRKIILIPRYRGVAIHQIAVQFTNGATMLPAEPPIDWLRARNEIVLENEWLQLFEEGVNAVLQISAVRNIFNLNSLHQAEADLFDAAVERFVSSRNRFDEAIESFDDQRFTDAADTLADLGAAQTGTKSAEDQFDGLDRLTTDVLSGNASNALAVIAEARIQLIEWAIDRGGL
jgi:hypothetical protein